MSGNRDEVAAVRNNLDRMADTLAAQLPPHIPAARFISAAMTAVQKNPDLLAKCNRESLYVACKDAAEDGLLPDGREGAIVPHWSSKAGRLEATWMPMVAGLVKLAWQCGNLAALHADAAYEGETFQVFGGTDPRIVHEYDLDARGDGSKTDTMRAVYAVAKLVTGQTMQAVLTSSEVAKIRAVSKSDKGPWATWYIEMAKVRAVRRLTKLLPLSSDRDADARMRRAAERGDAIDGVAEDTTDQKALAAPTGDKLGALEQALDLPTLPEQPEPAPVQQPAQQRSASRSQRVADLDFPAVPGEDDYRPSPLDKLPPPTADELPAREWLAWALREMAYWTKPVQARDFTSDRDIHRHIDELMQDWPHLSKILTDAIAARTRELAKGKAA